MTRTATFVKNTDGRISTGVGTAYGKRLWKVSPPVKYHGGETEFVVTSAATAMMSGPETYIFPADESGKILDFLELPGSYRGGLDHDEAIRGLCESSEEE